MNLYYINQEKQPVGPFSLDELLEKRSAGEVDDDTLVAFSGASAWTPLRLMLPENQTASVGPCPYCGAELKLAGGKLPERCPACGVQLHVPDATFMACVRCALAKAFTFRGRATRAEYWWFYLFSCLFNVVVNMLLDVSESQEALARAVLSSEGWSAVNFLLLFLGCLPALAIFVIQISLSVRRMHDIGKSGWLIGLFWLAVALAYAGVAVAFAFCRSIEIWGVILFGLYFVALLAYSIYLLVCFCTDSQKGSNSYGPSGKYPTK